MVYENESSLLVLFFSQILAKFEILFFLFFVLITS